MALAPVCQFAEESGASEQSFGLFDERDRIVAGGSQPTGRFRQGQLPLSSAAILDRPRAGDCGRGLHEHVA